MKTTATPLLLLLAPAESTVVMDFDDGPVVPAGFLVLYREDGFQLTGSSKLPGACRCRLQSRLPRTPAGFAEPSRRPG